MMLCGWDLIHSADIFVRGRDENTDEQAPRRPKNPNTIASRWRRKMPGEMNLENIFVLDCSTQNYLKTNSCCVSYQIHSSTFCYSCPSKPAYYLRTMGHQKLISLPSVREVGPKNLQQGSGDASVSQENVLPPCAPGFLVTAKENS